MSTFHHAFSLFKHDAGNLHVVLGWSIEGAGNHFGIDGACHVGDFLWTLVDEEHHEVCFGMVGSDGVGNVLHQHGLTSLGLCHDEGTLTFTDRREEVNHAGRLAVVIALAEFELLVGEEGSEELKPYTVTHSGWIATVDFFHADERKETFAVSGRTNKTIHHITSFQAVMLNLLQGDIDIVGRGQVVVVTAAEESVVLYGFEHTAHTDDVVEFVWLFFDKLLPPDGLWWHWDKIVERLLFIDRLLVVYDRLSVVEAVEDVCCRNIFVILRNVLQDDEIRIG